MSLNVLFNAPEYHFKRNKVFSALGDNDMGVFF